MCRFVHRSFSGLFVGCLQVAHGEHLCKTTSGNDEMHPCSSSASLRCCASHRQLSAVKSVPAFQFCIGVIFGLEKHHLGRILPETLHLDEEERSNSGASP